MSTPPNLTRVTAGHYVTPDGRWRVVRGNLGCGPSNWWACTLMSIPGSSLFACPTLQLAAVEIAKFDARIANHDAGEQDSPKRDEDDEYLEKLAAQYRKATK